MTLYRSETEYQRSLHHKTAHNVTILNSHASSSTFMDPQMTASPRPHTPFMAGGMGDGDGVGEELFFSGAAVDGGEEEARGCNLLLRKA